MDAIAQSTSGPLAQERIYTEIKEAITSLRLKPGQRLRTEEIARNVGASRTPVREALGRLAQEGLVERQGGWGYVVKQISVKDILDLYSVREALEVQAARELIPNLGDGAIAELVALNKCAEEMFHEQRYEEFLLQNRRFYDAVARHSGNLMLRQMLSTIHDRVRQVGSIVLHMYEPRARELLLENRRIVSAIRARDARALESAVRRHIRRGREHVLRLVVNGTGPSFPTIQLVK